MAQQQMVQIAESSAAGAISDMDPQRQRQILGVMGVGGKFGVLLPFSRKHESEADRIGLLLMAVSGRDPHAAIDFWQRMSQASRGRKPPEFMSTHPSDQRRVQDLERLLSEAMPLYERASPHIPDRPLPLQGLSLPTAERGIDRTASALPQGGVSKMDPEAVPRGVAAVLEYVDRNNRAPEGYEGGRTFLNLARDGEQALPHTDAQGATIQYREWDVHRKVPGRNRGAERLVTGSDGSAYYTPNHYQTFIRIR
jgi:guanyl-specific ribonuclease Sa